MKDMRGRGCPGHNIQGGIHFLVQILYFSWPESSLPEWEVLRVRLRKGWITRRLRVMAGKLYVLVLSVLVLVGKMSDLRCGWQSRNPLLWHWSSALTSGTLASKPG